MKKFVIIIVIVAAGYGVGWKAAHSSRVRQWWSDQHPVNVPPAENLAYSIAAPAINAVTNDNVNVTVITPTPIASQKNLAVPFTTQAPSANWDQDHEEFCEEASIFMVGRFFQHRSISGATDAEAGLQQIKQWELDNLGFYYDTTAAETASSTCCKVTSRPFTVATTVSLVCA